MYGLYFIILMIGNKTFLKMGTPLNKERTEFMWSR